MVFYESGKEYRVKSIKKGTLVCFTMKAYENQTDNNIWVRDEYDRESKTYTFYNWGDINRFKSVKGEKIVIAV